MRDIAKNLVGLVKRFKLISLLTIGLLMGGASGAVVMAAIPDTSGVIHGCYRNPSFLNSGGQVRIIDSTDTCANNEASVNWNSATPGQFVTNLVGADFTNTSLAYRNFTGQDMHGSTFTNSSLNGTLFSNANLSSSTFGVDQTSSSLERKANFTNSNFSGSTLRGSFDFTNATLNNTNLSNTDWDHAVVSGGDFRQSTLTGAALFNTTFTNANFSGYNFNGVHLATYFSDGTNASNADFRNAYDISPKEGPYLIVFFTSNSTAAGAKFNRTGGLVMSTFENTNVDGADFTGVKFRSSHLDGTDFSNAILTNVTWEDTICPDNTNSDNNGNTCIGHLVP
jgi:uncharacterized protein YjbI with pentapeptide repeats